MNFNHANVSTFFQNLYTVPDENIFKLHNVYNTYGTLVMVCVVTVIVTGNCVPPMFVFPRKAFRTIFFKMDQQAVHEKEIYLVRFKQKKILWDTDHQMKSGYVLSVQTKNRCTNEKWVQCVTCKKKAQKRSFIKVF